MAAQRRVLVLGAGRVSGPVYQDLALEPDVQVTAVSVWLLAKAGGGVSMIQSELEKVSKLCPGAILKCLDIGRDPVSRDRLVVEHDVIIGLVPYSMNPDVAQACLKFKKHLVTASYVDDEVKSLHELAKEAGLTFLCEAGLDPGIDHMLAMRTFDDIRDRGGEVISYQLWCGGLPAPENADNPLKYKFSWYPRGALWACCRGGGYMKNGKVTVIPPGPALLESAEDLHFTKEFQVEGFPNVYNPSYLDLYNINTTEIFIRGTLRYQGFSSAVLGLMKLGMFDDRSHSLLKPGARGITWRIFICNELGIPNTVSDGELEAKVQDKIGENQAQVVKRLGLLGNEELETKDTPIDTLANHLETRADFMFGPNERDLVVMHIEVGGRFPDGCEERRDVDMVVYGDIGEHSAMARTVGHTVASATMLVLNGSISDRGVVLPTSRGIYRPLLSDLEKKGIVVTDRKRSGN